MMEKINKLNGWQRIGVIISVLWVGFAGIAVTDSCNKDHAPFVSWERIDHSKTAPSATQLSQPDKSDNTVLTGNENKDFLTRITKKKDPSTTSRDILADLADENWRRVVRYDRIVGWLFGPVLLFWLSGYVVVYSFKWVREGFRLPK